MGENKRDKGNFGIIVSGGPAPGINSVISTSVIEANNRGYEVRGIVGGFEGLSMGDNDAIVPLTTQMVSRIYNQGGSILGTSRFNPFNSPEHRTRFVRGLIENNIDKLIIIGGEGTAYLSYQLGKLCPDFRIVSVPKTIDNDLILPNHYPSFGFETARFVGTKILDTLMVDARTTKRWYIVTSMGRKAGFLALGLGIASGATLTLIPEELEAGKSQPEDLADIIFGSMKKRALAKKRYGVAILAEGILDMLDPESSPALKNCPRDELGRIKYSEIELGDVLLPLIKERCKTEGIEIKMISKNIGYELRCAAPVSFDIEYTKFLGYGAVKHILEGQTNVMVTRDFDNLGFEPLEQLMRPDGSVRSRKVNLDSDLYRGARSFMIR